MAPPFNEDIIQMRTRKALSLVAALSALLMVGCGQQAPAPNDAASQDAPPVHWKMSSAYPSTMPQIGTLALRLVDQLSAVSAGNIQVRFYEPSALVPALEVFEAISMSALEAAWSTPGYWAGKVPSLQLFSAVPFGMRSDEYMSWFYFGGGKELFEEIYHRHNIHAVMCGMIAPEASGWFKNEIKSIEDFKGLKIRFFGLGGKVLEKIGASTQLLASGDIFPALELGTIDGTEFSMPAIDINLGFYQAANHYYFPGWHQQSTFFDLMINLDEWNKLTQTQRVQIEAVCGDNMRYSIAEGESIQSQALKEMRDKGVNIHRWSPEILAALEEAWAAVIVEESAKDPDFKRVHDSFAAFREKHKDWRALGYIN